MFLAKQMCPAFRDWNVRHSSDVGWVRREECRDRDPWTLATSSPFKFGPSHFTDAIFEDEECHIGAIEIGTDDGLLSPNHRRRIAVPLPTAHGVETQRLIGGTK